MASHSPSSAHRLRLVDPIDIDEPLHDENSQSWQLTELLARSRQADLYRARPAGQSDNDLSLYLVKLIRQPAASDPAIRRAIADEAAVGQAVSHPHLIPVLGHHARHERPFLVMPHLPGASLDHVLRHTGPLPVPHALWIVRQIAEAIAAVHDAGWLHGDIKPANIVVSTQGHATLIDLGSVMRHDQQLHRGGRERPLIGTLSYVAPEMLTSDRAIGPAADMYSLGATLYELLTGTSPFGQLSPADLARAHLHSRPLELNQIVPHVPSAVSRLTHQLLAKDPLRRPGSMPELISHLLQLEIDTLPMRWDQSRPTAA